MRRRGPGEGVVTVELLEGDDALALLSDSDDDDAGPDAARARRLRWVGLAVVAVLLGTILTVTVVDGRRDVARRAALAELGWVLPAFHGPVEEVWRSSGGWVVATIDDVLIVQDSTDGTVRAFGAGTGAVLWERDVGADEFCGPVYDYLSSEAVRTPSADTLVCITAARWGGDAPPEAGATISLAVIDAATGAELPPLVIDGTVLMQDAVDDDVLVTLLDSDAAIGVIRWDPRAGEVWSYRSAPDVVSDGNPWEYLVSYERAEDTLRLTDDIALDLRTGREVVVDPTEPELEPAFAGSVQVLADGGRVEWLWDDGSSGFATPAQVLNTDGSLRFEVEGEPWILSMTDGSAPEAIMTIGSDGEVVALDPLTGDELWSVPEMRDTWPTYLLDGILVAVGPTTVTALDAFDGTVLWQVDTRWAANTAAPTDGDVVLVQVSERPGSAILALGLRTGVEAWRMPGTELGTYWDLMPAGDGLLLVGDTEIIGYR